MTIRSKGLTKETDERLKRYSTRIKINNPSFNQNTIRKGQEKRLKNGNKESYSKTIPENVKQILLGSMLGDAGLQKINKNGNAIFRESHSLKQEDYLLWKEKVLSNFFGKFKIYYYQNRGNISISSKVHPFFTELHKIFYPNTTRKIRPIEALNQLKPLGLAVWYMDDGGLKSRGCLIAIKNKKDKEIVKEKLKEIFNLNVTIHKNCVYFNIKEANKFRKLIKPYIHANLKYKIKFEDYRNKIKEGNKKNYWSNPQKYKKKALNYYYDNIEERIKYRKEYHRKNRKIEKIKGREYYKKNREEILEKNREYNKRPEIKLRRKEYDKKRYRKKIKNETAREKEYETNR